VIPVTPTPDPLSEKYYSTSPYVQWGNNPIRYIDPDGRDWQISRTQNEDGSYVYNITVNGVLYNNSSNSSIDMSALQSKIQEQIGDVFNISGDGFSVNMTLNLKTVTSVDDISSTDHVFQVVDQSKLKKEGELANANLNGLNIRIGTDLVESTLNGTNARSIAHELGHTGGLKHPKDEDAGLIAYKSRGQNLMTQLKYTYSVGKEGADASWARNLTGAQIGKIWNNYDTHTLNQGTAIGYRYGLKYHVSPFGIPIITPIIRTVLKP
jgi:hypothetical protein